MLVDELQKTIHEVLCFRKADYSSVLQNAFVLNGSSGEIKVHHSLDREALSRAVLVINVTDTNAATNSLQTSTGPESF